MNHEVLDGPAQFEFGSKLYPEQQAVLESITDARAEGIKSGYIDLATGLGKTHIVAHDIAGFRQDNPSAKILYLCHNGDILAQARKTLESIVPDVTHGNIYAGEFEDQEDITYATFQTLNIKGESSRNFQVFDPDYFDYVVVDESHHAPAETYKKVIEYFQPKFRLGLTATPDRRDQKDIKEIFITPIHTITLEDAIAKGYLATPNYMVVAEELAKVNEDDKDSLEIDGERLGFRQRSLDDISDIINAKTLEVEDARTIVFCPDIVTADQLADKLRGISYSLHSKLPEDEQKDRLKDFRDGIISTLTVVDKLNEGVDVPEVNIVVFLRSTESRTVFLQQLGRGLRKIPGKETVNVIDFVANWNRLRDVVALESGVNRRIGINKGQKQGGSSQEPTFKINFSAEAFNVLEILKKSKKQKPVWLDTEKVERKATWEKANQHIMEILGLSSLPDQRITAKQWRSFELRLKTGDELVKEELLMCRLRTCYVAALNFARRYGQDEVTIEDYFQEALIALNNSINEFARGEHAEKTLIDTLAFTIYSGLNRFKNKRGLMTKIENQMDLDSVLRPATVRKPKGKNPETLEIDEQLYNADRSQIVDLDLVDYDEVDPESMEEKIMESSRHGTVEEMMDGLSPRERRVLELRLEIGEEIATYDKIAREFMVTKERVRQIELETLKKLADLIFRKTGTLPFITTTGYRERSLPLAYFNSINARYNVLEATVKNGDRWIKSSSTFEESFRRTVKVQRAKKEFTRIRGEVLAIRHQARIQAMRNHSYTKHKASADKALDQRLKEARADYEAKTIDPRQQV